MSKYCKSLIGLGVLFLAIAGLGSAWAQGETPAAAASKAQDLRASYQRIDARLAEIISEVRRMNISPDEQPRERQKVELFEYLTEVQRLMAELDALDAELVGLGGTLREGGSLSMEFVDDSGAPLHSVRRNQRVIAQIPAVELAGAGEIGEVTWTVTTPGGRQVHPRGEKSGESGLRMSMRPGDNATIGEFRVKADVNTASGVRSGEGTFSLIEGEITPTPSPTPGGVTLTASIQNPITGRPALVVMPELPFVVEDPSLVSVVGIGEWADGFFTLDAGTRRIQFRGKKEGAQNPQFEFVYGEQKVIVSCPTDVAISIVETHIFWGETDMRRREIPLICLVPDYFEPPFKASSSPNRAFEIFPDEITMGDSRREQKGAVMFEWLEPRRRMELRLTDATGAECIADIDFPVEEVTFKIPKDYKLGDEMELELPGWPRIERAIGGARIDRLIVTPNIRPESAGSRLAFLLVTKKDDPEQQSLLLVAVGNGGVAKGTDEINIESCVCCDPPRDVADALRGFKNPFEVLARINTAARSEDAGRFRGEVFDSFNKQIRVFRWWGELKDCRHMSPKARDFFLTMARVLELAQRDDEAAQEEAHQLMHKLQRGLGHEDFEEGFMCDTFEE